MEDKIIHIAVVPSAGYSHLFPILQFSKRLVDLYPSFQITCLIPTLGSPKSASKSFLETLPPNITCNFLPPVNPNDLPQGSDIGAQIQLTVTHSLPSIHHALKSLTSRTPSLVALIVDTFAAEALDFAKEFNLLSYVYFPIAATTVSLSFYMPKLDEETSCEYRDLPGPIKVPGCVPLHGKDLYTPAQDRSSQVYRLMLKRIKRFFLTDGVFVNSFLEMETGPIRALSEGKYPDVYAVGPIVQTVGGDDSNWLECVDWLDTQKPCSVLFVCFGSGGTLSQEQMNELALGLELSGHKFLWVVRPPSNEANAAYLAWKNEIDPLQFLPSGFLERTKDQGLVVPLWAPQVKVLSHGSVGGFLSHCGWNSTLESVMQGVPLISWPLFAEQRMNAVLISEGLKVGLRPKVNENDLVERKEVAEVIKRVMEGEEGVEFRQRMKELKEAATIALKEDGSSTKTLSEVILKWKNLA
ncbi:hypothetical protein VNO77_09311 [Canavalia gladiata]|uniref:Glycosyltransferase n=1 Tax=Canavalia gladiata TaxID=3824 RepID=A0AAN9MAP7_CANGL